MDRRENRPGSAAALSPPYPPPTIEIINNLVKVFYISADVQAMAALTTMAAPQNLEA
jgi:hypothetical protein